MNRSTPIRRRRRATTGTADQRARFKTATLAASTGCPVVDDGHHDGPLQAHHVTAQEAIRKRAAQLRLGADRLADLLWNPSNGLAVCRRHHDRHTLARRRLPLAAVSIDARRFARDLDLEHLLDRYYRTDERRPTCSPN